MGNGQGKATRRHRFGSARRDEWQATVGKIKINYVGPQISKAEWRLRFPPHSKVYCFVRRGRSPMMILIKNNGVAAMKRAASAVLSAG